MEEMFHVNRGTVAVKASAAIILALLVYSIPLIMSSLTQAQLQKVEVKKGAEVLAAEETGVRAAAGEEVGEGFSAEFLDLGKSLLISLSIAGLLTFFLVYILRKRR